MVQLQALRVKSLAVVATVLCGLILLPLLVRPTPSRWLDRLPSFDDPPAASLGEQHWPWAGRAPRFAYVTYATNEDYLCVNRDCKADEPGATHCS